MVDSFTSDIQIDVVSRTLKNEYCPGLVTSGGELMGGTTDIVALPKNVSTDEIFKPVHEDKTIGIFTYFAVNNSNGKSKVYPAGDYVLIGGNSMHISQSHEVRKHGSGIGIEYNAREPILEKR